MSIYLVGCVAAFVMQTLILGKHQFNGRGALVDVAMVFLSWVSVLIYLSYVAMEMFAPGKLSDFLERLIDRLERFIRKLDK